MPPCFSPKWIHPNVSGMVTAKAIMQPHDMRKCPQNRRGPRCAMKRWNGKSAMKCFTTSQP